MNAKRALEILQTHNEWRRDNSDVPRPIPNSYTPTDLGKAIDVACDVLKQLIKTEPK